MTDVTPVACPTNLVIRRSGGMAQVAMALLRYRPVPVIPIIDARKLCQLERMRAKIRRQPWSVPRVRGRGEQG
jgi:hypothetical protein